MPASQAGRRGFESHLPLHFQSPSSIGALPSPSLTGPASKTTASNGLRHNDLAGVNAAHHIGRQSWTVITETSDPQIVMDFGPPWRREPFRPTFFVEPGSEGLQWSGGYLLR